GAFHSMRRLYCMTDGRFNASVAYLTRWWRPPIPVNNLDGILGRLTPADLSQIVRQLDVDGFYVFPRLLPQDLCDKLGSFARDTPVRPRPDDTDGGPALLRSDPANPRAVKYECPRQTLMEGETAQQLVADPTLFAVAQAYLRTVPVQDLVAMWWST